MTVPPTTAPGWSSSANTHNVPIDSSLDASKSCRSRRNSSARIERLVLSKGSDRFIAHLPKTFPSMSPMCPFAENISSGVRGCARMENKENCHWRLSGAAQSPYYQMSCASVAKRPLPHNRLWYGPAAGLRASDRSLVPARVFAVSQSLTAGTPGVSVGVANPERFTRHQGPSIMGFEDQVEQSLPRPCREIRPTQADIRTHLIHRPARDIISPLGGSQIVLLSDLILYVLTLRRPP